MRNHLPVRWNEGMFLLPHHFQAAERALTEESVISESLDHAYNYGLKRIEFSEEAIANQEFEVQSLKARLKDGTVVALSELDRISLKKAFEKQVSVKIYLGVPALRLGPANVGENGDASTARYKTVRQRFAEENEGGSDEDIDLRTLNARILSEMDDLSGFEVLPIAQVVRSGDVAAIPQVDKDYFPPLLACEGWPPLATGMIRAIFDIIGARIDTLAAEVISRDIMARGHEQGDLERIMMLLGLNTAHAMLQVMAFAQGIHPLTAYTALATIVGQLSILRPDRKPPEIPRYDHDDLGRIFRTIRMQIEQIVGHVKPARYEQRPFKGAKFSQPISLPSGREGTVDRFLMEVAIEEAWLSPNYEWYIGVDVEGNMAESDIDKVLREHLIWKVGSAGNLDVLIKSPGLEMTLRPIRPRILPASGPQLYYRIEPPPAREQNWRQLKESRSAAIYIATQDQIKERDKLIGSTRLTVDLGARGVTRFSFTLYLIPGNQT